MQPFCITLLDIASMQVLRQFTSTHNRVYETTLEWMVQTFLSYRCRQNVASKNNTMNELCGNVGITSHLAVTRLPGSEYVCCRLVKTQARVSRALVPERQRQAAMIMWLLKEEVQYQTAFMMYDSTYLWFWRRIWSTEAYVFTKGSNLRKGSAYSDRI